MECGWDFLIVYATSCYTLNSYLVKGPEVSAPALNNSDIQRLYNVGLQIELIIALLNGLMALNIHVLIAKSTSIPKALDNPFLAPLYLLSLQLLVAFFFFFFFLQLGYFTESQTRHSNFSAQRPSF